MFALDTPKQAYSKNMWLRLIMTKMLALVLLFAMANANFEAFAAYSCGNYSPRGCTGPICNSHKGGSGGGSGGCDTKHEGGGGCDPGSGLGVNIINTYTGNATREVVDLEVFGAVGDHKLNLRRTGSTRLNGMTIWRTGGFGRESGWTHNYMWLLRASGVSPDGEAQLRITYPEGGEVVFRQQASDSNLWLPSASIGEKLYQSGNDYTLQKADGWQYFFEKLTWGPGGGVYYRITGFEDSQGNVYTMSYLGGGRRIHRVTDPSGRWIQFAYEDEGIYTANPTVLARVTNPAPDTWLEIDIPSTKSFRHFALRVTNNWKYLDPLPVAEIEFVKELDGNGDPVLLSGSQFGSDPALNAGEEYDKAFDGNTSSFYRYAHKRNAYAGIDLGVDGSGDDVKDSIIKARVYISDTAAAEYANFQIIGLENRPSGNVVLSKITSSDGREVVYNYAAIEDASGNFTWSALSSVDYPDGAQANYSYEQVHAFTRPVLKHSIDPRIDGRATNIEYGFHPDTAIGFATEERNGATGELIGSVGMISAHKPQAIYPDGRTLTIEYTFGRPMKTIDGLGNATNYTYDQGGLGFVASKTDALGNATSYVRDSFGLVESTTLADGSSIAYTRDSQQRALTKTESFPGESDKVTTWARNGLGQVTQRTAPDGSAEQWTYNGFGQKLTHTQKNGAIESWQYDASGLKTKHIDALGNESLYSYNALDQMASSTDADGAVTSYEYNDTGKVTKITHPDGGIVSNVYDDFQNLITSTDELGNTTNATYDALKRQLSTTDALGRATIFDYGLGAQGCASCGIQAQPTRVTYPDGRVVKSSLDLEWRVISKTDAFGDALAVTSFTSYDAVGNILTQTDYLGNVTTFAYDNRNRRDSITDALGQTTSFTFDEDGNTLTTTRPDNSVVSATYDDLDRMLTSTDAMGDISSYAYNSSGTVASVTDALGRVTSFSYDDLDRRTGMTYADGTTTATTYDVVGNVISQSDALGKTTTTSYDVMDRPISVTDATGRTTNFSYPPASGRSGRRDTVTSPSGKVSKTIYNATYRPISVTAGFGTAEAATVSFAYDNMDRIISTTDADGGVSTTAYDLRGRTLSSTDALGFSTQYAYDDNGNNLSVTAADGVITSRTYDALNRSITSTDGENRTISNNYGYDGRLLSYTDARGKVYAFTYDDDGQQTGRQFPDGTATTSSYDAAHNLLSFTKADGVVQSNSYDNRNRLTQTTWNDGSTPATSIAYDANGRTIQVDHDGSIVARTYDDAGRQLSESQSIPAAATGTGVTQVSVVAYAYNADGLLDIMTRPDGSIVQSTYTARNQVDQILLDGPPPVVDYDYNARGLMTSKTYESGGLNSTMTHNARGQVLSVAHSSNAGALEQLSYGYSAVGQRLYMQRADGRGDLYGYDDARQLTGAGIDIDSPSTGGIGLPVNDMSYAYDLGGNRSQSTDAGVVTNYTANDVNEYSAVAADVPVHDDNGNLTAGDGLSMSWDAHNRLMHVEPTAPVDGDQRAFYQYDGTGRRISKIVDQYDVGTTSWVANEVRSFVYDGWNVIREGVVDTSTGGIVQTQVKRYTWGIDLSGSRQGAGGVGGLLMAEEDNDPSNAGSPIAAYYYTNDANGNVTTITDSAGVAVAQYEYDGYGNVVASVGAYATENPFRYSTKYSDD